MSTSMETCDESARGDALDVNRKSGETTSREVGTSRVALSVSRGEVRFELRSVPYCSFEPMRHCAVCDADTPFLFHDSIFLKYRKCWKHLNAGEKLLVREMYDTVISYTKRIETHF